jgi:uroporphyrin-III C-methyltransferase
MEQTELPQAVPRDSHRRLAVLAGLALALVLALTAALWWDARARIGATQEELARRLRDIESQSQAARTAANEALEAMRQDHSKLAALEARVIESQGQQLALEALYQELSRGRDEWQLAEIEQVLAIAQQQLQLSGNVRAALLALQLAESRLAKAGPQFVPLRRALARDIERLRSVPAVDLAGMSLRVDALVAAVDSLPLAFDERAERPAAPAETDATPASQDRWMRFAGELWRELRQLIVVRRVETAEPPLLPPSQAYFVRENLKLRLLNARVSLLVRDEAGYREDLRVAQRWIERYFDTRAKPAQNALAQLKQLAAGSVSFEPPSITDSLEAVRSFNSRRERG